VVSWLNSLPPGNELSAFPRLPFGAPYVGSGAGHAPLEALRAMEKTLFSLQYPQYPIKTD